MNTSGRFILGAGVTGLSTAQDSRVPVLEENDWSGGIVTSYYHAPAQEPSRLARPDCYRFELGGGHWIFGGDHELLERLGRMTQLRLHERQATIYLPQLACEVPYPLQYHLYHLPPSLRERALGELLSPRVPAGPTMRDWLHAQLGDTLCELFFFPFHELYTAGLFHAVAPRDAYKTPLDRDLILQGATAPTPGAGYNRQFAYPVSGLDALISAMAARCEVQYECAVREVDTGRHLLALESGRTLQYDAVVSTIPLNRMASMAALSVGPSDPSTAVLVINLGARRGARCPDAHWVYVPVSHAGFHRVGIYSNVDRGFLPAAARESGDRVAMYIEKAYRDGERPSPAEVARVCDATVRELQEWGFIEEPEVVSPTWIDVAYTWRLPSSKWAERAVRSLRDAGIHSTGRYGKWRFQGIADSIRDGLRAAEFLSRGRHAIS